jgi:glycosyltransferase involved in cell wall biosynthesis
MKVVCVIPAYNEAKTIGKVVAAVKPLVDGVIVVDDSSADNTEELARAAGADVVRHVINRGQGAALQTGDEYALKNGADIIVHFDADDQFLAEEITAVVAPIKNGAADIVFGSRFLGKESEPILGQPALGNQTKMPRFKKYFIMPLARFINRVFFGVNLTDPQSGFRAMTAAVAEKIKIENDGMAHCNEILIKSFYHKFRVQEVPITVIYHDFGQKFGGGFRIIKDLIYKKITR